MKITLAEHLHNQILQIMLSSNEIGGMIGYPRDACMVYVEADLLCAPIHDVGGDLGTNIVDSVKWCDTFVMVVRTKRCYVNLDALSRDMCSLLDS